MTISPLLNAQSLWKSREHFRNNQTDTKISIDSIPTTRFDTWYTVCIVSRLGTGELIAGIIQEKLRERDVNSEPRTPLLS